MLLIDITEYLLVFCMNFLHAHAVAFVPLLLRK